MHTVITHVGKNVVFVEIKSITLNCYNFLLKRYINLSLAQDIVVVYKQIPGKLWKNAILQFWYMENNVFL